MSHGISKKDSMFSYNEVPWHGLGVVLKKRPRSIQDALKKAGLGWPVVQKPIYLPVPKGVQIQVPIEGYKANVRKDTGDVLGIVSDTYEVVQNAEAFEFLAALIGSELHFETAGSLWGGKQVWVLAETPDHLEVGGDAVRQFVLVTTRHDGGAAVRAKVTPVRVVCNNTLTAALQRQSATYKVRHLSNASVQLHEAREVLGMTINLGKQFAKFGNKLASKQLTERKLAKVLEELYPNGESDRSVKSAQRRRETVMHLFIDGDTVGNAPGTQWSGWNAIVEHYQHDGRFRSDEGQFVRAMEDPDGFASRALQLVTS